MTVIVVYVPLIFAYEHKNVRKILNCIKSKIFERFLYKLLVYSYIYNKICYHITRNIVVELNLVVGKINCVSPSFILSTFNDCVKNSKRLHFNTYQSMFFK